MEGEGKETVGERVINEKDDRIEKLCKRIDELESKYENLSNKIVENDSSSRSLKGTYWYSVVLLVPITVLLFVVVKYK